MRYFFNESKIKIEDTKEDGFHYFKFKILDEELSKKFKEMEIYYANHDTIDFVFIDYIDNAHTISVREDDYADFVLTLFKFGLINKVEE